VSPVTFSVVWSEVGKVSHVTVSGAWRVEGKGVTCYGCIAWHCFALLYCFALLCFALPGLALLCIVLLLRFLGLGGLREKVSHVTVSGGLEGQGKWCHMLGLHCFALICIALLCIA
jgi:hypothetical protein